MLVLPIGVRWSDAFSSSREVSWEAPTSYNAVHMAECR